jgi:hypothetical protein
MSNVQWEVFSNDAFKNTCIFYVDLYKFTYKFNLV